MVSTPEQESTTGADENTPPWETYGGSGSPLIIRWSMGWILGERRDVKEDFRPEM